MTDILQHRISAQGQLDRFAVGHLLLVTNRSEEWAVARVLEKFPANLRVSIVRILKINPKLERLWKAGSEDVVSATDLWFFCTLEMAEAVATEWHKTGRTPHRYWDQETPISVLYESFYLRKEPINAARAAAIAAGAYGEVPK